jgi:transposase
MVIFHVGIDIHRRSWTVCIIREREVVFQGAIPPQTMMLLSIFKQHGQTPETTQIAYEIGGSGFWIRDELAALGFDVVVAAPCQIPREPGRKIKTDPRDARELADLLRGGMLRSISIPTPEERAVRGLVRTRGMIVAERTSMLRRIKAKLMFQGIDYGDQNWSGKFKEWIRSQTLPTEVRQAMEHLIFLVDVFDEQIVCCEKEIAETLEENSGGVIKMYKSVPAFGKVTCAVLATELGDLKRFATPEKAVAFVGLCPGEYSSGESIRRGRITRQGNVQARTALVEAAWRVIRLDPEMKKFYGRLVAKKNGKQAIVAVARKLLHRLWTMFQSGELYEIGRAA